MHRALPVLPVAAWAAILAAAVLDDEHDVMAHYISWLVDGPWAPLAALGVLGLAFSTALAARHLRIVIGPGPAGDAVAALLASATVLGLATMVLPSRGFGEPVWRTAVHVGLAVGAYVGIGGAALLLAWLAWKGRAPRAMMAWAAVIVAAAAALLVAAAIARLTDWGVEVRGLMQIVLAGAAAVWLAAALAPRRSAGDLRNDGAP